VADYTRDGLLLFIQVDDLVDVKERLAMNPASSV